MRKKISQLQQMKKRWELRTSLKNNDENHALFMAFVLVLTALVIINSVFVINRVPTSKPQLTSTVINYPTNILTSEQQGQTSSFIVGINNVTENSKPDPAFTLSDQETLLIMNISITNTGTGDQNFIPVNQLFIHSQKGDYATMHPSIYVTNPIQSGVIKPSKTISGQISFNIPKTLSQPLLYVDLGWNNSAPIVFDVLK